MLEPFSSRYLMGQFYTYPEARPDAVLNQTVYEATLDYVAGPPIVLKLGNQHFDVYGDTDISYGNLAMPKSILDSLEIDSETDSEPTTVLIARDDGVGATVGF